MKFCPKCKELQKTIDILTKAGKELAEGYDRKNRISYHTHSHDMIYWDGVVEDAKAGIGDT